AQPEGGPVLPRVRAAVHRARRAVQAARLRRAGRDLRLQRHAVVPRARAVDRVRQPQAALRRGRRPLAQSHDGRAVRRAGREARAGRALKETVMAHHTATVRWQRGDANFLDRRYSRAHTLAFDGGAVVPGSSSPHVVPLPMSDAAAVDPEEAFVAALASCHMLWFLDIASRAGYVVD